MSAIWASRARQAAAFALHESDETEYRSGRRADHQQRDGTQGELLGAMRRQELAEKGKNRMDKLIDQQTRNQRRSR